jgi:cation transport regulator ChaB
MPQLTLENPIRDQKYREDRRGGAAEDRQEEAAHRIAWAAVKRSYVKLGNDWVARR